jgi:hypothetical protein
MIMQNRTCRCTAPDYFANAEIIFDAVLQLRSPAEESSVDCKNIQFGRSEKTAVVPANGSERSDIRRSSYAPVSELVAVTRWFA